MISISFKSLIRNLAFTTVVIPTALTSRAQLSLPAVGMINTVAGGGTVKFGAADGGPAIGAELSGPNGVAVDALGNIYIAETDSRIRKVTASTGIISTVAGTGAPGYSGDGGPATNAELSSPFAVAADRAGNLYIADFGNSCIRKVTVSTGMISTVAGTGTRGYSGDGGPAINAQIGAPYGVALDALGNIYIADYGNYRVRKVTVSTGIVSTVAGTGVEGNSGDGGAAISAEIDEPYGVAVDASGNIYIATGNIFTSDNGPSFLIRKVTASTGTISTFAGNGTNGNSGDGGPATSAALGMAYGLAVDSAGDLYIADAGESSVREVTASTGIISTIAGTGTQGFSGDGGPAIDAEFDLPFGVAVESTGHVYIADNGNNRIRAVGVAPVSAPATLFYAVTVTSSDPNPVMSESVTVTATVLSNLNLPATSGTVTWFDGATSLGESQVNDSGQATLVTTLGAAGNQLITANYAGSSQSIGTLFLHVTGFTFTAAVPAVTVTSGQSVQVVVNGSAYYGFSGPVDLTCSGMPSPGSCSLSAGTVNFNNNTTNEGVTLTVETAGTTASGTAQAIGSLSRGLAIATLFPLFGLFGIKNKRYRSALMVLLIAVGVAFTAGLTGCGGQGVTTTSPSQAASGVKPGTYTVTVVAQSGSISVEVPVTVIVQ